MKYAGRSFCLAFLGTVFVLLVSSSFFTACSFDKEEILYPADSTATCDTVGVSYASYIQPLVDNQCLICHSLSAASGGVVLEQHSDILPYAQNGKLVTAVEYNSSIKMPQTGKLPDCDIAKIRSWVRDGALNN
jgi:hypothetical protein